MMKGENSIRMWQKDRREIPLQEKDGTRYWVRTSDPLSVSEVLYH